VTTTTRSEALPDIPTMNEFVPGFEASAFYGLGSPKNTPAEIVDRINKEINAALTDPKIKARLADLGGTVLAGSSADLSGQVFPIHLRSSFLNLTLSLAAQFLAQLWVPQPHFLFLQIDAGRSRTIAHSKRGYRSPSVIGYEFSDFFGGRLLSEKREPILPQDVRAPTVFFYGGALLSLPCRGKFCRLDPNRRTLR
jgi:Tripartite tricarboxylate transporter family receptor